MTSRPSSPLPRVILLTVLVCATTLAGCLGDEDSPTSAPSGTGPDAALAASVNGSDASLGTATGTVRVEVVNAELEPLIDVDVAVAGRTSRTGADGMATLTGVPVGTHNLSASKDGWREGFARVTVTADLTSETRVKLLPGLLAPAEPSAAEKQNYTREYDFEGVFECSLVYLIIPGDCLTIVDFVDDAAGLGLNVGDTTEEQNAFDFPLDRGWETVILEQVWEPVVPGTKMQVALEPSEFADPEHTSKYARVYGENPLYIRLERGIVHETAHTSVEGAEPGMPNPDGGEVITSKSWIIGEGHDPEGHGFLGVGFAYGQRFSVFVTVFYGEAAPDGFTRAR